ncbi:MAG: ABC transporter ATP-binding protein [Bifidobacteriaceae bacterium]|jgi:putative ABC transport system ATP-binding protein|nr:ABC transporter ATP-binding protein [Bifidobacteriaceae bacterium]
MAEMEILRLENVRKVYSSGDIEFEALRGVSLSVGEGEYVSVVGPSGSGKSTLMNILGCLDVATEGRYEIAGEDVSQMAEAELADVRGRRIGFVFQQFNLLPSMSAWRNVELPLSYAGVGPAERKRRAVAALESVGLGDKIDNRPGQLSGGQQQRAAIARALVTEPMLLLADEPTGNLDSVSAREILDLFDQVHSSGRTIVLITHDWDVASRTGRSIEVRDGMILERSRLTESAKAAKPAAPDELTELDEPQMAQVGES